MSDLPLARVTVRDDVRQPGAWYWDLPAIAQLRADGLALAPVTVLVGENGTGKSTVVESVALAWQESLTAQVRHWGRRPLVDDADAFELRPFGGIPLNARSHGEGFLAFLESRTTEHGLWILDEPESALSFRSQLRLLALLHAMAASGSQVLLATHSRVLAALPGATVYELDGDGLAAREWQNLDLVQDWVASFDDPERLLHHLLDD